MVVWILKLKDMLSFRTENILKKNLDLLELDFTS